MRCDHFLCWLTGYIEGIQRDDGSNSKEIIDSISEKLSKVTILDDTDTSRSHTVNDIFRSEYENQ